jgi:hypothetical protein
MQPTPVTRSRLPIVAIAVWALILAAIVGIGLAFGRGSSGVPSGAGGANAVALSAPLAADPSPSAIAGSSAAANPSESPGTKGPGPRGFGPGRGFGFGGPGFGPGGPGGPGRGFGQITITAVNGNQLSLKTDDGWTRTIDASGAKVTDQTGTALTIGDLKVGDQIRFQETRNADGTYKVTAIVRVAPEADGTVKSVDAGAIVVTEPDGSTTTINVTSSTTYTKGGQAATAADVKVGDQVRAIGTNDNGFTATKVDIQPASVDGTVTAKTSDTITVKDRAGNSVTVHVTASTTYQSPGKTSPTLADVAVNDVIQAQGTKNSDGSLAATTVRFGTPGQGGPFFVPGGPGFGPGGPGFGHGRGGPGFKPGAPPPGTPNATPAPSTTGG